MRILVAAILSLLLCTLAACTHSDTHGSGKPDFAPREIIDLGAPVTEDLAYRVWGKGLLASSGLDRPNRFEAHVQNLELGGGSVSVTNSFYTIANHGGPHVDAPVHVGLGSGLDGFDAASFAGPLEVFDVREFPEGRSVPAGVFAQATPGAVVLIHTGYSPPENDVDFPKTITLTIEAAEFLARLPVRAFGTDSLSVASLAEEAPIESENPVARAVPIHHAFLSRGIPVYEQLFNVERLLDKERMFFVGVPLNIPGGDGMLVRPLVFVY